MRVWLDPRPCQAFSATHLIEAHGERFWVSPNTPHGAMFQFTLPTFGGGEGGGLIERIQAMIFQRSSEVWINLPMAGIGPFTVPSPKRW